MSRCYACSQENCGYGPCSCDCHNDERVVTGIPPHGEVVDLRPYLAKPHVFLDDFLDVCTCKKHRRYQAKRKPTSACELCWRFYVRKNP